MMTKRNLSIVKQPVEPPDEDQNWRARFAQADIETEAQSTRRGFWLRIALAVICLVAGIALLVGYQRHTTERVVTVVGASLKHAADRVRQTARGLREASLGKTEGSNAATSGRVYRSKSRRAGASQSIASTPVQQDAGRGTMERPFEVWVQDRNRQLLLQPVSNSYRVDVEQGTIYRLPVYGDPIIINSYNAVPSYWTQPQYPIDAQKGEIQGVVVLRVLIGEDGRVQNVGLESGPEVLGRAAVEAVRQWRYAPYSYNGKLYAREALIRLGFSLVPQLQTSILKP